MKLRSQFVILIVGIITAPFLVAAFMAIFQFTNARRMEPLPDYAQIDSWLGSEMPEVLRKDLPPKVPKRLPRGFDVLVIGRDDAILYSTIAEFANGTHPTQEKLMRYMRDNASRFHFQLVDMPGEDRSNKPSILLRVPRFRPNDVLFRTRFLETVMYTSLVLLVFSALASALIVRRLTRSILNLEHATRRVASGDLEFRITAKGKNEIASLTRSFDSMRVALKEETTRRTRFIMGVSHDLKTPIALIQGYVEAIEDGYAADPEAHRKYLAIIGDKARALEGMVNDLIGFVRMETGEWKMTHRDLAVREFLLDLAKRYSEDAFILKRSFTSSIDVPADTVVTMDENLVSRALENLIGNSIRYTEENGRIELSARLEHEAPSGESLRIDVRDTGIGIPQAELNSIFDPFYRGTNSRREHGFGLGLTTVKSIIESHGWRIDVKSVEGQGTVFTIAIPGVKRSPPPPAS